MNHDEESVDSRVGLLEEEDNVATSLERRKPEPVCGHWQELFILRNTMWFIVWLFVFPAMVGCLVFLLHDIAIIAFMGILVATHVNISVFELENSFALVTGLAGLLIGGMEYITCVLLKIDIYKEMIYPVTVAIFICLAPVYCYSLSKNYLIHKQKTMENCCGFVVASLTSVFLVFGQLYATILLAPHINSLTEVVLFCSAYPLFILSFKIPARAIANKCSAVLGERIEFQSIIFAALPFRFLFINIAGNWMILMIVMIILIAFKVTKFSLQFHPNARFCCSITASSKKEAKSELLKEQIAYSFYFQVLFDLGSTPLTAVIFLFTRTFRTAFSLDGVVSMSQDRFRQLMLQLLASFIVDLIFLGVVLFHIPALLGVLEMGYVSVLRNLNRYCLYSIFLVVMVIFLLGEEA